MIFVVPYEFIAQSKYQRKARLFLSLEAVFRVL